MSSRLSSSSMFKGFGDSFENTALTGLAPIENRRIDFDRFGLNIY